MSKIYFCTRPTYGGYQCGETNPEKFSKGRYSECKECKNRYTREYFHNKKEENIVKKVEILDPKQETRLVVEDTILRSPILNGISVKDAIKRNEESVSDVLISLSDKIDNLTKHLNLLSRENQILKQEIEFLKK